MDKDFCICDYCNSIRHTGYSGRFYEIQNYGDNTHTIFVCRICQMIVEPTLKPVFSDDVDTLWLATPKFIEIEMKAIAEIEAYLEKRRKDLQTLNKHKSKKT